MKLFTNQIKTFFVLCLLLSAKFSLAQLPPCTGSFSYTQNGGGNVTFNAMATGYSSVLVNYCSWNFGNGSTMSGTNIMQANTNYTANGTYTVTWSYVSPANSCTIVSTQTVLINSICGLNIAYTIPVSGTCNVTATVTSTGLCSPSYTWSNGATGNVVTLCQGATYWVLASSNSTGNCCPTVMDSVMIPAPNNNCGLNAGFTSSQGSNGVVNFNNTTTGTSGGVTYLWNFGDGNTSTSTSPSHTYSSNGTYVVTLLANNNTTTTCVDSTTTVVYVNSYCNLSAAFTMTAGTNGNVYFNNTSTGTNNTTYAWIFGDGNTGSGSAPIHVYTNGTYTVTMIATNNYTAGPASSTCISTASAVVTVTSYCPANANFTLAPTGTPQYWNAIPVAPGNVVAAIWSWGDGSTSNTLYTSHTYSAAGNYNICLSVTVSCGATDSACYNYSIYRPSGTSENMGMVYVNVLNTSVGINHPSADNIAFIVSPNPNNGSCRLLLDGLNNNNVNLTIYNLVGQQVYSNELETSTNQLTKDLELGHLSNGVYFIKVETGKEALTKKIVIDRN